MQIKKALTGIVAGLLLMLPNAGNAQESSINTYSPYTLYGIGDILTQGPAFLRSMGGAGVAYRDLPMSDSYSTGINSLNPASYSAMPRQSFLFNFELEGQNYFLKDGAGKKSSYNSFNVKEVGIMFPIATRLGMSVSVSPYSSVGYRMERLIDDPEIVGNIGEVKYTYTGEGDISQIRAGIGWEPWANKLSFGVDMLYYVGSIDRKYGTEITGIIGSGSYNNLTATLNEHVSKLSWRIGAQYNIVPKSGKSRLTLGATYQPGLKLNQKMNKYIPANDIMANVIADINSRGNFSLPDDISAGVYYNRRGRIGFTADYNFQNWGDKNKEGHEIVEYRNTNTIKAGMHFTPDRFSARNPFSRVTYRLGVRHGDYYMNFRGEDLKETAVTLGATIPIGRTSTFSTLNIGIEGGQRGTTKNDLVKEQYIKVSIGLSLFGDYWFLKRRFD